MTGTPLLERPTSPPQPPRTPRRSDRADRIFALLIGVVLLAAVAVVWFATNPTADTTPTAPGADGDTTDQVEPAAPAPQAAQPAPQPADEPADLPAEPPSLDIRYREELRANWDVTRVAADDVLNVRSAPGAAADIVATLAPDAAELESTGRIADVGAALWREVVVPGDGVGWVNAAYLTETTGGR